MLRRLICSRSTEELIHPEGYSAAVHCRDFIILCFSR